MTITSTLRTFEEQAILYAKGRTEPGQKVTNARPGQSYHQYGMAFDFAVGTGKFLTYEQKVNYNKNRVVDYVEIGQIGENLGLEWGGRFKKPDIPHFQYTNGLTIDELISGCIPFPIASAGTRPPEGTSV